ncbi:MAG: hypothetical protein PHO41_05115 [Eubacteriales bacterium]|nr:hypothetical protein [Eubacteriales bacterium]
MHNGAEHSHTHVSDPEENKALLAYMLDHNAHHAEELHTLAHGCETVNAQAAALLHEAVAELTASNEKIKKALQLLTKE